MFICKIKEFKKLAFNSKISNIRRFEKFEYNNQIDFKKYKEIATASCMVIISS